MCSRRATNALSILCHRNDPSWEPWCVAWNGITQTKRHKHLFGFLSSLANWISHSNMRRMVAWLTVGQTFLHGGQNTSKYARQGGISRCVKPRWLDYRGEFMYHYIKLNSQRLLVYFLGFATKDVLKLCMSLNKPWSEFCFVFPPHSPACVLSIKWKLPNQHTHSVHTDWLLPSRGADYLRNLGNHFSLNVGWGQARGRQQLGWFH